MQLGLGTAALGRPQYINLRQEKPKGQDLETFKEQGFAVLENAYNLGIRYFDTAPGYGLAEQLVLEWLRTKNDPNIQIATKWGYTYVANFDANATIHEIKEHTLKKLREQWEVSKALIPHLRVYQIHSATLESGVLDNKAVLDHLAFIKQEYLLEIGITVTGANQLAIIKKALDVAIGGKQLFDAFQVTYNMLDQSLDEISGELVRLEKKIIIKEALANGRVFRNKGYKHYDSLYDKLERLANKYGVGTDAIALQFCGQRIPKSIVLSGASSSKQLKQNLKFNTFRLTEDELQELAAFKIDPNAYWEERKQLKWN
ncbi:aldo/keto reductase [uncultured Eudoraea sp.]|uniref:aldo/keto reductase n=1 Tax=uncultured Eudoraea sp. TaxID=1035614 RepID=UPI00260D0BD8|nr:aldo/keto reductase [uncultured Eudoraea sp.]